MKIVAYVTMALGAIALALCAQQHLWIIGAQGYLVMGFAGLPILLIGASLPGKTIHRAASIFSLICFALLAIKCRDADFLRNIMLTGAAGALCSLILAIKPPTRV